MESDTVTDYRTKLIVEKMDCRCASLIASENTVAYTCSPTDAKVIDGLAAIACETFKLTQKDCYQLAFTVFLAEVGLKKLSRHEAEFELLRKHLNTTKQVNGQ